MYSVFKKPFYRLNTLIGKSIEAKRFNKAPLYVGGSARSGTTILLSVISSHPEIFACPKELGLYSKIKYNAAGEPEPFRMDRLYRTLITEKIKPTATFWCEKSPNNVQHIRDIDTYHNGNFRFIHLVRDGRDVVLSKHPTRPNDYWVKPERWLNDVKAGWEMRKHPHVLTIYYEDLILNYEETIRKICDFLNIETSDEILNWFNHTTVRKNKAYFGDVKPLDASSIGKWKQPQYKERVEEFLAYPGVKEMLGELGYV